MKKGAKKRTIKKDYSSDHVAVILERMDGKFDLLAEGQKTFERRFDNLENEFDKLGNRLDRFEADVKFQFNAIGEGMSVLSDKVDNLEVKVDNLEGRFDNLEVKVDNLEVKVDNLEVKVDNLEVKVDNLEENLNSVAGDVVEIKHKLSQKVDLEDFQKLEKKVVKLEKLILSRAT